VKYHFTNSWTTKKYFSTETLTAKFQIFENPGCLWPPYGTRTCNSCVSDIDATPGKSKGNIRYAEQNICFQNGGICFGFKNVNWKSRLSVCVSTSFGKFIIISNTDWRILEIVTICHARTAYRSGFFENPYLFRNAHEQDLRDSYFGRSIYVQALTQGGCRGCIPPPDLNRCWHDTWFHWKSSTKIFLYCTLKINLC